MGFVSSIYGNGFFCTGMLLSGSFSTKLTSFFMPSKLYLQNFLLFWLPVFNLDVLFGRGGLRDLFGLFFFLSRTILTIRSETFLPLRWGGNK